MDKITETRAEKSALYFLAQIKEIASLGVGAGSGSGEGLGIGVGIGLGIGSGIGYGVGLGSGIGVGCRMQAIACRPPSGSHFTALKR